MVCGSSGVSILAVPIFDAFGQKLSPGCNDSARRTVNVAVLHTRFVSVFEPLEADLISRPEALGLQASGRRRRPG